MNSVVSLDDVSKKYRRGGELVPVLEKRTMRSAA
jgi:hypothetical protein